jgi:hypothetical protein
MSRQAAIQCHGTITFHHLDGQNIFGRAMSVRWSGSPEPTPIYLEIEGKRIAIIDPTKFTLVSRTDVYPGEAEVLDVAARFDNENDCYGWSNENYFSNPIWRNPNWKLPQGRYLVNVTVVSSGEKCAGIFRLINDVPQQDFRIEPAQKNDKVYS